MDRFIRSIHSIYPLGESDLAALLAAGKETDINKGELFVSEGKVNSCVYVLKQGVMRAFWNDEDREVSTWFATVGEAVFSSWCYVEGKPSKISITASTDCSGYLYTKEQLEHVFTLSDGLSVWGRRMFERLLLSYDQWLVDFSKPLAADRYAMLEKKMPEILQNVPLKDIAAYLGMTPQSLSRIRAGLAKKNKL